MSTDTTQVALDDVATRARDRQRARATQGGARYRGRERPAASAPDEIEGNTCRACGRAVVVGHDDGECPPAVARVVADAHDRVPACPECTGVKTWSGAAAAAHGPGMEVVR